MRRVLLIGDSIRLSYQNEVRARLADVAFVSGPNDNGQHTVNLLLNLWSWVITQAPDVVHLNAGLWDSRRLVRGGSENVVPLEQYETNVRRILTHVRTHLPAARVIWATTTPVIESQALAFHARSGLAGRCGSDIARYNAAATRVAASLDVPVNDLHAVVIAAGPERLLQNDGTHFNDAGVAILADTVAAAVRSHLS